MDEIKKVVVVGSGVMGSGIAALVANSGTRVAMLDIVPEGAASRNMLTEKSLERMKAANPSPFTHPSKMANLTIGNVEDNLNEAADADWIIEAVLEKLDAKQSLYSKLEKVRKPGSVVSSNTSTIPLHNLIEGMPERFGRDFMIAHFFNPPRFMRLLELVQGKASNESYRKLRQFADVKLGKGIVDCKDTPGFIANRIGVFWLETGLLAAIKHGLLPEEADALMSRPVGIPKTGIFGLYDLIGIDLMQLIAKALLETLPDSDRFREIHQVPEFITKMIAEGYTGRKGKGGFYRINAESGKKVKETLNLATGAYSPEAEVKLESLAASKAGLQALVTHPDKGGKFVWDTLSETLSYAASLLPEIADDIVSIDETMRLGYNWKYGPFELIDIMGGPEWFASQLRASGKKVPPLIEKAGKGPFYKTPLFFTLSGEYKEIQTEPGSWRLEEKKRGKKPVAGNAAASLWDIGDGVACFELHTKMNAQGQETMDALEAAIKAVGAGFKTMIIGGDADNFSAGANLQFFLDCAAKENWGVIEALIERGQNVFMALKYASFPSVAAVSGYALGGGCELALSASAVVANVESSMGLVETSVGLIPGWGGCKEARIRSKEPHKLIMQAQQSASAEYAKEWGFVNEISMNRLRLLADAKRLALALATNYKPPARVSFQAVSVNQELSDKATEHDKLISSKLAEVLGTAGSEEDMLAAERKAFMELIRTKPTQDRISHMLETGKPLKN